MELKIFLRKTETKNVNFYQCYSKLRPSKVKFRFNSYSEGVNVHFPHTHGLGSAASRRKTQDKYILMKQ